MKRKTVQAVLILLPLMLLATTAFADAVQMKAVLSGIANDPFRSTEHRARNQSRHPDETLSFFGIRSDMTVVEITPGGAGWYTEILAPFLRPDGKLYAANLNPKSEDKESGEYFRKMARSFSDKMAADPTRYDKVSITIFDPPTMLDIAPAGSADMVLTFRNFHNWIYEGSEKQALQAFHRALKPGGILGVVQHRGDPTVKQDPRAEYGYVREDYLVQLVEAAGFERVSSSEINANPKDTRDYSEGVWTLPPAFELGDKDRDKYATIGESDRMTLKFIKKP